MFMIPIASLVMESWDVRTYYMIMIVVSTFCRICNLLDALCNATDKPTFFNAMWRCILGSSDYRLPAVNLLLGKLNKRLTAEDQVHCVGGNLPLVVSRRWRVCVV
jgi:hypothetical protein